MLRSDNDALCCSYWPYPMRRSWERVPAPSSQYLLEMGGDVRLAVKEIQGTICSIYQHSLLGGSSIVQGWDGFGVIWLFPDRAALQQVPHIHLAQPNSTESEDSLFPDPSASVIAKAMNWCLFLLPPFNWRILKAGICRFRHVTSLFHFVSQLFWKVLGFLGHSSAIHCIWILFAVQVWRMWKQLEASWLWSPRKQVFHGFSMACLQNFFTPRGLLRFFFKVCLLF